VTRVYTLSIIARMTDITIYWDFPIKELIREDMGLDDVTSI